MSRSSWGLPGSFARGRGAKPGHRSTQRARIARKRLGRARERARPHANALSATCVPMLARMALYFFFVVSGAAGVVGGFAAGAVAGGLIAGAAGATGAAGVAAGVVGADAGAPGAAGVPGTVAGAGAVGAAVGAGAGVVASLFCSRRRRWLSRLSTSLFCTTNSTRRFFAMLAADVLGAIGLVAP